MKPGAASMEPLLALVERLIAASPRQPVDREEFLALDAVLSDWIIAAEATNEATDLTRAAPLPEPQSQSQAVYIAMLVDRRTLSRHGIDDVYAAWAYEPTPAEEARWKRVRQLLDVYDTESSAQINEWLVGRAVAVLRLRSTIGALERQTWSETLQRTLDELRSAQLRLRRFITAAFPLGGPARVVNVHGGIVGTIGDSGAVTINREGQNASPPSAKPHD